MGVVTLLALGPLDGIPVVPLGEGGGDRVTRGAQSASCLGGKTRIVGRMGIVASGAATLEEGWVLNGPRFPLRQLAVAVSTELLGGPDQQALTIPPVRLVTLDTSTFRDRLMHDGPCERLSQIFVAGNAKRPRTLA